MCKTKEIPAGHKECVTCDGEGEAVFSCCSGEVVSDDMMICPECHEHLGEEECTDCDGKGYVAEDKEDFTDQAPSLQAQADAYRDSVKYGD
jgi:DnaJ-class molecular chaperone